MSNYETAGYSSTPHGNLQRTKDFGCGHCACVVQHRRLPSGRYSTRNIPYSPALALAEWRRHAGLCGFRMPPSALAHTDERVRDPA